MDHIDELVDALSSQKNPVNAKAMSAYMRGKFEFLGIKSPFRKQLVGSMVSAISKSPIEEVIDTVDALWGLEEREYQMVGLDLLVKSKKKFKSLHLPVLESWIVSKAWWDTVDLIASHNIGYLFYQDEDLSRKTTSRWLESENIWLNRSCLIYQLKYKKDTDLDLLFSYIAKLNHKDEFFIQKAIGWSLRQASKFYPTEIGAYIESNELSKLAVKEGSKYL